MADGVFWNKGRARPNFDNPLQMSTVRKLSYRSDLGELQRITRDVSAYCREQSIDPDTALALTLCLNELFTNTLKYGYRPVSPSGMAADDATAGNAPQATAEGFNRPTGAADQLADTFAELLVEVDLERQANQVLVRYSDRGQPFNPFINPRPLPDMRASEPEALLTGGFGIHILRQLCSDARYAREGESNVISLTFAWQ